MAKIQHPWQVGPTELIEFALERMHQGSDVNRRLAFLILDVGVETLFKTYLTLPSSVVQFQNNRKERDVAVEGNFHELLNGIQTSNPEKASKFNFAHIVHYHRLRNTLYHEGSQVAAVPMHQLEGYAKLAVSLLREYLDVNLSQKLKRPSSMGSVPAGEYDPREAEGRKRWTKEMFFADVKKKLNKKESVIVNQLYEFTRQNASEARMGTGAESGSFTFVLFRNNNSGSLFSVYSNGNFTVNLGYMESICTPEEIEIFRSKLATIPTLSEIKTTSKYYFTLKCATVFSIPAYLEQFRKEVLEFKDALK